MGKKYYDGTWGCVFYEELCEEICKFEEHRDHEHLKRVKDLTEVINNLQEMEMNGAIMRFAGAHSGMFNNADRRDRKGRNNNTGTASPAPYYPDERAYPNGSNMDENGMYMLRQQNGMPIMTPYNMSHDVPKKLTDEQCEEWIKKIVNFDGSEGGKWSKAQVEAEAKRAGIDISKYGACLMTALADAMYADYGDIARSYNCDKPSFYIRLAEAFLDDEDFSGTPQEKASIYFYKIVEH